MKRQVRFPVGLPLRLCVDYLLFEVLDLPPYHKTFFLVLEETVD